MLRLRQNMTVHFAQDLIEFEPVLQEAPTINFRTGAAAFRTGCVGRRIGSEQGRVDSTHVLQLPMCAD